MAAKAGQIFAAQGAAFAWCNTAIQLNFLSLNLQPKFSCSE
jgi:hypothetical protein